jgi:putative addiction module component (TIGR02574 family)
MTHKELLATIELLPKNVQFAIANSVLDRLANEGPLPISDELKAEFLRREEAFFANPDQGEPWERVRTELFGK